MQVRPAGHPISTFDPHDRQPETALWRLYPVDQGADIRMDLVPAPSRTAARSQALYFVLVGSVCAHFSLFFATRNGYAIDPGRYVQGTERLPFQFEALTGWIGYALAHALRTFEPAVSRLPPPFDHRLELTFLITNFTALTLATVATRRSIERLTGDDAFARLASFLVPLMSLYNYLLMMSALKLAYPYDLPQLALFALCVNAIIEHRLVPYYGWFLLACFNGKTSIFVAAIFVLWRLGPLLDVMLTRRAEPFTERLRSIAPAITASTMRLHIGSQIAIFVAARVLVFALYHHNMHESGSSVLSGMLSTEHLTRNLHHLTNPIYWPGLSSNFAFLWIPLVLGFRHLDHPGLRWSLLVIIPWVLLTSLFGSLIEMRVFGELISLVAVSVAVIAHNHLQPRTAPPGTLLGT